MMGRINSWVVLGAAAPGCVGPWLAEAQQAWFAEEGRDRGIDFFHDSGHDGEHLLPECVVGGCALVDLDGDGDLDAYLVQSGSLRSGATNQPPNRLYLNAGDGTFACATEGSGAEDPRYGMGVAAGDYDNDGDLDLYVTNVGRNTLLRNEGDATFTDVTNGAGVGDESWGASAAFFDADGDGDLDLYVTNYVQWSLSGERRCFSPRGEPDYCSPGNYDAPARDTLYRNDGDGTFTDLSEEAGLGAAFGNGLGVVCADFDLDGRTDVFVANDGTPDQLWRNLGDGRFEDVAMRMGCAIDIGGRPKAGMGTDVVDLDRDGDQDLLVVNLAGETDAFWRNEGEFFIDDTFVVGLGSVSRPFTRFGVGFFDFDHDGLTDLFQANGRVSYQPVSYSEDRYAEPNLLYRGTPDGVFEEVTPRGGTEPSLIASSRGAAFGDVDGDGDIDVLICNKDAPAHLLINRVAAPGRASLLRVLDKHGRDAFNAVVELTRDGATERREVRSAFSYCAASDPRLHVGLGDAGSVGVRVRWLDGSWEDFGQVRAGEMRELRRGAGRDATRSADTP